MDVTGDFTETRSESWSWKGRNLQGDLMGDKEEKCRSAHFKRKKMGAITYI